MCGFSEKDQANRILAVQNVFILIVKMSQGLDHVVNYFAMYLDDVVNGTDEHVNFNFGLFLPQILSVTSCTVTSAAVDIIFFGFPVFNY